MEDKLVEQNLPNTDSLEPHGIDEGDEGDRDRYQTPQNCHLLVVPKVNLEFWFDLQKSARIKNLSLQEIQKYVLKATQPLVIALDKVINAKNKELIDPSVLLPELADEFSRP